MKKIFQNIDLISKLFPAHILISRNGRFISYGPYFNQYSEIIERGENFFDIFSSQTHWNIADFCQTPRSGELVRLRFQANNALMYGMVVPVAQGYLMAVNLIPTVEAIDAGEFQIDDFGLGDPLASGVLALLMQQASLDDARKSAQDLAIEQERTKEVLNRVSRMAGYMAHDFNNFLSIIELSSDVLLQNSSLAPNVKTKLKVIKDTALRASETTQSLMTLAKLKYDSKIFVKIDEFIWQNTSFFKTISGHNVKFTADLSAKDQFVHVSNGALLNSLINLVINARDSITANGEIVISTRVSEPTSITNGHGEGGELGRRVVITVNDNGSGMSDDVARQAFEPLFSTKAGGNGMGLASVHEFCREMGGDASLLTKPGIGTAVTLNLPAFSGKAPDALRSDAALPALPKLSQSALLSHSEPQTPPSALPKALVVEDEQFAREALSELLEGMGLRVDTAADAHTAIAYLERENYDLLLTDVVMPGMSGIELALWAEQHFQVGVIVLMSGQLPAAEALGETWRFMRKPLNAQRIRELVYTIKLGND